MQETDHPQPSLLKNDILCIIVGNAGNECGCHFFSFLNEARNATNGKDYACTYFKKAMTERDTIPVATRQNWMEKTRI